MDQPFVAPFPNPEPYSTPGSQADLYLKLVFSCIGNLVCLIPMRNLYRHGEFAAVLFIIIVEIRNIQTFIYGLLWPNNNMDGWWLGWGLCDIHPFIYNASIGLFATCLLAIMRNLAHQVGLLRVNPLTIKERRRKNVIQALIIFPLPIIMLAFTWPLTSQRYVIAGGMGCMWTLVPAWPAIVFFALGPVVVATITVFYALLTFFRFRQVAKLTQSTLGSNREATLRSQRTKRRLYLMVASILVPVFPVMVAFGVYNCINMLPLQPFDYNEIHRTPGSMAAKLQPFDWNTPVLVPSNQVNWEEFEGSWITIFTTIPIFVFFGMTKDALNDYRKISLIFGAGRIWPKLYEEYDPDRVSSPSRSGSSGTFTFNTTAVDTSPSKRSKLSQVFTKSSRPAKRTTVSVTACDDGQLGNLTFITSNEMEQGHLSATPSAEEMPRPPPMAMPTRRFLPFAFLLRPTLSTASSTCERQPDMNEVHNPSSVPRWLQSQSPRTSPPQPPSPNTGPKT